MEQDTIFETNAPNGSLAPVLAPRAFRCDLSGLQVMAIPPGTVEMTWKNAPMYLNLIPDPTGGRIDYYFLNGRRLGSDIVGAGGSMDIFAHGSEHVLAARNHGWELLVEMDEQRVGKLAIEAWDGQTYLLGDHASRQDPAAMNLSRLAIEHLRFGPADPLYIEGLAIALAARGISFASGRNEFVSTKGTDHRISRAIDYIEAHLDEELSVAAIAGAACMSPSWLKSSFPASTGKPVWAFVRERRLERARHMLADQNASLAQIAYACGFSSHSHMSRLFREHFGVTPRELRE